METIKLRPKQLEALTHLQSEKAKLNLAFENLNNNESLLLSLILEEKEVNPTKVKDLKLADGAIIYELVEDVK